MSSNPAQTFFAYKPVVKGKEAARTVAPLNPLETKKITADVSTTLRSDNLQSPMATVQDFSPDIKIKPHTSSSLTAERMVNRLLPAEFVSTDLTQTLMLRRAIALEKFCDLQADMATLGISFNVGGTFFIECAADFLRKKSLVSKDVDAICVLTDRKLVSPLYQFMIQHKFKCKAGEKDFYRFVFEEGGTLIDITVMLPGHEKKPEPFLLLQKKMKVFKDSNKTFHFQLDEATRAISSFYINEGIFPVELFLTDERNKLRHFLARLAKYLIKCQDNLIIKFVIRENGRLKEITYPEAEAYMRSFLYAAFAAKSPAQIKHHYSSIKKIITAGIVTHALCRSLIITPMCEARLWFSLSYLSFNESVNKEAINQMVIKAARNMATILEQYFKEHIHKAEIFSSLLDLLAQNDIADLANENNIVSYVKIISSYAPVSTITNRSAFKLTGTPPITPTPPANSQPLTNDEFKIRGLS